MLTAVSLELVADLTHLLFPIMLKGKGEYGSQISPPWMAPHSYKLKGVVLTLKITEGEETKPACVYYVDGAWSSHLIFALTLGG